MNLGNCLAMSLADRRFTGGPTPTIGRATPITGCAAAVMTHE